jgi:hypothetical protein
MISNASPGSANPKMNKSFGCMAHVFFNCACAKDWYLKLPYWTIMDGDTRWDSGWFLGGFEDGGHGTCD